MDVQFHEEETALKRPAPVKRASYFTQLVYKLKLAKTEAEAQRIMLILAVFCLVATLLVVLNFLGVI